MTILSNKKYLFKKKGKRYSIGKVFSVGLTYVDTDLFEFNVNISTWATYSIIDAVKSI